MRVVGVARLGLPLWRLALALLTRITSERVLGITGGHMDNTTLLIICPGFAFGRWQLLRSRPLVVRFERR